MKSQHIYTASFLTFTFFFSLITTSENTYPEVSDKEIAVISERSNGSIKSITEVTPNNQDRILFCGVPDEDDEQIGKVNAGRVRRYSLHGNKWDKMNLTWTLRTPSRHIDRIPSEVIRREIHAAMEVWERESGLTLIEVPKDKSQVDIYIDFLEGDHSDGYIFDGPGRVLAHAFYPGPRIGGDLHFDDSENFVAHHLREKYKGKSLLITAAHELGHSLGLRHSDVENALMAPYYQDFPEDLKLPFDDKYGIQTLYGRPQSHYTTATLRPPTTPYITPFLPRTTPYKPQTLPPVTLPTNPHFPPTKPTTTPTTKPTTTPATKPTTTPTTKPTTTPTKPIKPSDDVPCPAGDPPQDGPPDTCDTDFDAVIKFHGEFYFFKDSYYWRISRKGYMYKNESPNRIWNRFPGLPTSMRRVDAVYVSRENTLIFFGGSSYYELGRSLRLKTTGKLTDLGVNVSYLDTAMVWGHNGRIYLFSGDHYWRLGTDGRAEPDYPRDVTVWRGLPRNYSAAFTVRSSTYFLSGHVFWSFDSLKMRISEPPSMIAPYWFSCPYYKQNKLRHCFPSSAPMTHPNHHLHLYIWIAILCLTSL